MTSLWDLPDFDAHEAVHFYYDEATGLRAIIAQHSTHLGPAAGGVRFWRYDDVERATTDALRLSRGMSYKNAMAGLPMGGGKAVIIDRVGKSPALLAAFARAVEGLAGGYVTAQDVGMSAEDIQTIARTTRHVSGLPASAGNAGGDPGPSTALGVYLGVKAAVRRALGTDSMRGIHVAIQGVGSVGGGLARLLAADGARLTLADVDEQRAAALAGELGAATVPTETILGIEADVVSPCALGAILTETSIAGLRTGIIAGGANNQLATIEDGDRLQARGILYAPDYVINAGGIINVALEYLGAASRTEVEARIQEIPGKLDRIWTESQTEGLAASRVADRMARTLIGRD